MLKKLDKLILTSFIGPLLVTTSVLVFIFLVQFLILNFDSLIGKNLPITVYLELIFYLSLQMIPQVLPLGFLLAALMTYGTLGEFSELTAIKSAGISLVRVIQPVFFAVIFLAIGLIFFSNYVLPKTNLQAFSLLYDIKTKKMGFSLKPGAFYYGLPGYAIKANHVDPDGRRLKQVIIYDHSDGNANKKVTMADSGMMYTIYNDRYLVLELFNGSNFSEVSEQNTGRNLEYVRNKYSKSKIVFSLSSFDLNRTRQELFSGHKFMRNLEQLQVDIDSMEKVKTESLVNFESNLKAYYNYLGRSQKLEDQGRAPSVSTMRIIERQDNGTIDDHKYQLYMAANQARNIKTFSGGFADHYQELTRNGNEFKIEMQKKFTLATACLVLFLIGAPVGSIIRKGGLGVPILVGIIFFILYYILTIVGEKWAKEGVVQIEVGLWAANLILFGVALFFLQQARRDASLFDLDFYSGAISTVRGWFQKNKAKPLAQQQD
jgi:lipopolysaccharide export system permease protein